MIRWTHECWGKQRRRGPSADDSWKVNDDAPLAPPQAINTLEVGLLVALVEATTAGSRSRGRASQAASTVARALDSAEELMSQLRDTEAVYRFAEVPGLASIGIDPGVIAAPEPDSERRAQAGVSTMPQLVDLIASKVLVPGSVLQTRW